jgi:hypothetical protein
MKTMNRICALAITMLLFAGAATAQTAYASSENGVPVLPKNNENPVAPSSNQEKVVLVKNTCEKSIAIFAGPKEGIRDPKMNSYGGLSTNKVYVMPNDVVCLMNDEKKPVACTIVKPETSSVEVNSSGNGITAK